MTRNLFALALLVGLTPAARSQDMPLSQILIDGKGWGSALPAGKPGRDLGAVTLSRDKATRYTAGADANAILAHQIRADGTFGPGVPYAPLRTKQGERGIAVTGLTTDRDGRIYAATEIGVQVFDPTGRLCGVLTPAAPGTPSHLAFEGNELTLWIGEMKYTRKLNTSGVK